jgi:hypothetical protein
MVLTIVHLNNREAIKPSAPQSIRMATMSMFLMSPNMHRLAPFGDPLSQNPNVGFIEFGNNAFDPPPKACLKLGIILAMRHALANVIGHLAKECIGQKASSCFSPQRLAGLVAIGLGEDRDPCREMMVGGNDGDLEGGELQSWWL